MAEQMESQRRVIFKQLEKVERFSGRAVVEQEEGVRVEGELERLNAAHTEFAEAGVPEMMKARFLAVIPLACYFIDLFLLAATTEAFASVLVEGGLLFAAKLAMPLLIIVLEFGVGILRSDAGRLIGDFGKGWARFIAWTAAGVLITTAMISVTAATVLLPYADSEESLSVGIVLEAIALSAIAGVAHGTLCFGAERIHAAFALLAFRVRRGAIVRRLSRHTALHQSHEADTKEGFRRYMHTLRTYNDANPQTQIEPGPFSVSTVNLVNRLFGYGIITRPGNEQAHPGNGGSQERERGAAQGSEVNGGSPEATGEEAYLRTVLAGQVRAEEEEIRP